MSQHNQTSGIQGGGLSVQSVTSSLVDRDRREASDATERAVNLLKMQNVDVLALLKDAYHLGFVDGLRRERSRYGTANEPLKGEACGRWVGNEQWWDIEGESISDADLRRWIRNHLPENSGFQLNGAPVAYHTRAYANRRLAIDSFMRTLRW